MYLINNEKHKVEIDPEAVIKEKLIISVSNVDTRAVIEQGQSTELTITIKDSKGNSVPLSENFAVPVRRIGGAVERTIGISFTDGVASKKITWPSSGEFEITEDLINMHLPEDQHFKFDRLVFSVYE